MTRKCTWYLSAADLSGSFYCQVQLNIQCFIGKTVSIVSSACFYVHGSRTFCIWKDKFNWFQIVGLI